MASRASGTFDVKLNPMAPSDESLGSMLARMSIDKQFRGDLDATSKGEMLSAGTAVTGSAGYVALECVTGILHGRTGSFVLQHNGIMTRGTPALSIVVVPDSGTGELVGINGRLTVDVVDGKHLYDFAYTLGETA
jgi:hypothetical protein